MGFKSAWAVGPDLSRSTPYICAGCIYFKYWFHFGYRLLNCPPTIWDVSHVVSDTDARLNFHRAKYRAQSWPYWRWITVAIRNKKEINHCWKWRKRFHKARRFLWGYFEITGDTGGYPWIDFYSLQSHKVVVKRIV